MVEFLRKEDLFSLFLAMVCLFRLIYICCDKYSKWKKGVLINYLFLQFHANAFY